MPARFLPFVTLALAFASVAPLLGQENTRTRTPNNTTSAPAFVLADVHPSPWINYPYVHGGTLHGDRYSLRQATMIDLISAAYGIDAARIQGGPNWVEFDRYDIVARAPSGTPQATLNLMLRSLLATRFHLVVHDADAQLPAYALTAVKPKLGQSGGGNTECAPEPPPPGSAPLVSLGCHNMPMGQFAGILQRFGAEYLRNQPVVDSTGLRGHYDFAFHWTPHGLLAGAGAEGVTLFAALEKQLGLKLDLRSEPLPVLFIDGVERTPTPNPPGIDVALPPQPAAQFEVAVIRPSRPDEPESGSVGRNEIDFRGDSLKYLIQSAWNLNLDDDEFLVGLPKWGASDRYDVHAKASAEEVVRTLPGGPQIEYERARQMLRMLLIERFGIQAHMEERPVTAYNLEADRPKLRIANPAERTKCFDGPGPGEKNPRSTRPILNRVVHCQDITVAEFGRQLPYFAYGYIYAPVRDDTGLSGRYDFTLSFSSADRVQPDAGGRGGNRRAPADDGLAPASDDPNGALSLFEAVRRELGLRLKRVRRPAPVLVIDHINRQPSAN